MDKTKRQARDGYFILDGEYILAEAREALGLFFNPVRGIREALSGVTATGRDRHATASEGEQKLDYAD